MTGVSVRIALEVILMFGLRLPKISRRLEFRDHLSRPEPRCVDVLDGVLGDVLLLIADIEDGRAVADHFGIENDLNGFGMRAVIAVGGIAYIAARIAHASRDDARITAQQI